MRHVSAPAPILTRWLPHTRWGAWATGLLTTALGLFALFFALVASGQRGGDSFLSNLWLSGTILPGAILAVAGAVTGLAALRRDDHTIPVYTAITLGLAILLFVTAEITAGH